MSYILDALKKAEQERKLRKPPDIMSEHYIEYRPKQRFWLYAVFLLLAAASGSIGWFFGSEQISIPPPQPSQNVPITAKAPESPAPAAVAPAIPPSSTPSENVTQPPQTKSVDTPMQISSTTDQNNQVDQLKKQDQEESSSDRYSQKASSPKKQAQPKQHQKKIAETPTPKKVVPGNSIYSITDLPEEIRGSVPALIISTHIYSQDKTERLASINGHIGREGQEILKGIKIVSIVPDGAILSYQGYRFKVGLK
ncbi:MAG TPA: general secretion pathway protein GspB [Dissulfurispiraceae bacterium]|nr:general secretion pathway protein GspB [Dissulfurispiraceae bacterium]